MKNPQKEAFDDFARFNAGIPKLTCRRNKKTSHVHWGDGSMQHYHEFSSALADEELGRELREIFQRHVRKGTIKTNRTVLGYGSVHGCITYAPHEVAEEIKETVLRHFNRALKIVATRIENGTTYADNLQREFESSNLSNHADTHGAK
jgi:hypothetical protein